MGENKQDIHKDFNNVENT